MKIHRGTYNVNWYTSDIKYKDGLDGGGWQKKLNNVSIAFLEKIKVPTHTL